MLDTAGSPVTVFHGLPVEAIAAYANGRFANVTAAREAFPHALVLEIDVSGQGIGHAGDFEAGDMPYGEAGPWAKRRIAAGVKRPVIYCSVSSWPQVSASLRASGLSRADVRLWTAHYDGRPHLCSSACNAELTEPADATQWGSADAPGTLPEPYAGRNLDVSETGPAFW
ncbi:MAG: hypothetical protein PGN13_07165 [Patulibacter minatonensis]